MTLIEAAKQAREAFEWNLNTDLDNIPACERWAKMLKENIAALNQAIADAEKQEPVSLNDGRLTRYPDGSIGVGTPPQPPVTQRTWVGLTDEQMAVLNFVLGADDLDGVWFGERHPKEKGAFWWRNRLLNAFHDAAIEAKLREKNQ